MSGYYDGGRLVPDTPVRLSDDQRNTMADLAGEGSCGDEWTPGRITYVCVLDDDHDGPHESHGGFASWTEDDQDQRDPDEIRDSWEPDTMKEWRGEA